MHAYNLKVLAELRDFATKLKTEPRVTVRLRLGGPATAMACREHEGVLAPELLEWARCANGLRLEWHRGHALQGVLHVPTLLQFSRSKDSHGLEVTGDEVIQRFNLAGQGNFVCMVGSSDGLQVFDGDYLQPCTEGSLAEVLRAGIRSSFQPGWEANLNAMADGEMREEE